MTERLPTGIEVLDRRLDGGIPKGRMVALTATPASQSELFLYELASMRPTVYLSTARSTSAVNEMLKETGTEADTVHVHHVDADNPLAAATEALQEFPDQGTVIVDPVRRLEQQTESAYEDFLNELRARAVETEGIAFLHCLDGRAPSGTRDLTEYMADIVFELSTEVRGDTVENNLLIPKFRGGQAMEEAIKLNLTAGVSIDISRKIA